MHDYNYDLPIIAKDRSKLLILVAKIEILGELTTSSESLFHKDMIFTANKLVRALISEIGRSYI